MAVKRIEALIDAIAEMNNLHNPESEAYQMRNPLMIGSFAPPGKHEIDSANRRVFTSLLSGYKAADFDITLKLQGYSRTGLRPSDTLSKLLEVYSLSEFAQKKAVSFLRRALKDQNITLSTPLTFFTEDL